jgi:hypothetical protein
VVLYAYVAGTSGRNGRKLKKIATVFFCIDRASLPFSLGHFLSVGELTREWICRAYPGCMGRRVRGTVRAFPLGCAPETTRLRVLGLRLRSGCVSVVACTRSRSQF